MLTLTPERSFSIKSNFDAHVNQVYDLIRLNYTELLEVIPNESPSVEETKGLALEVFQTVTNFFRVSRNKEQFAEYMTGYAKIFIYTGIFDGERSGNFFSEVIEVVQSCLKSTKELLEQPPTPGSEGWDTQN